MDSAPQSAEEAASLEALKRVVAEHRPELIPGARRMRRAAVAANLIERDPAVGAELLLIRRAEHPGDPWSGHMAFPGGRMDPVDASSRAAAVRETAEEIGLDLESAVARDVGRLSDVLAVAHGRPKPMIIRPHVFELKVSDLPELVLQEGEVEEVVLVPFSFFLDGSNRRTMTWRGSIRLPCYDWEGRRIWGLTLEMIDELRLLARGEKPRMRRRQLGRLMRLVRRPRTFRKLKK